MSSARVKENIVLLLESIVKRSHIIEKETGSESLLSIDLAMEDLRLLYRQMEKLRTLTSMEMASALTDPSERIIETVVSSSPKEFQVRTTDSVKTNHTPKISPETEGDQPDTPATSAKESETAKPIEDSKPEIKPSETTEPVPETKVAEKPDHVQSQKPDEPIAPKETEKKPEPAISRIQAGEALPEGASKSNNEDKTQVLVGEKFAPSKNSVHERLAQIKEDKSIGARLQQKPVSNIKDAIGLNEKFLFINELFNGDLEAYNRSVNQLNTCPGIHEAFEMLNQLTLDYNWDGQRSSETIDKFANIVQRRYMD